MRYNLLNIIGIILLLMDFDILLDVIKNGDIPIDNNNNNDEAKLHENICNNCNITLSVNKDGIYMCNKCGNTFYDKYEKTMEWNYDDDKCDVVKKNNYNFFYPHSSISTVIMGNNKLKKIQDWNQMPYDEKRLYYVAKEIHRRCANYGIYGVVLDNAKILYKHVRERMRAAREIRRGANNMGIIAGCVFYGAMMQNLYINKKKIAHIFDIKQDNITWGCRKIKTILKDDPIIIKLNNITPIDYINQYLISLDIDKKYYQVIEKVCTFIIENDIALKHHPNVIAACSILIVCNCYGINITRKFIAIRLEISEITLTKAYEIISEYIEWY